MSFQGSFAAVSSLGPIYVLSMHIDFQVELALRFISHF